MNAPVTPTTPVRRTSTEQYMAWVDRAREYIRAGDVFQVVPSQRFETTTTVGALDIYRVLRARNPSPYLYLLRFDGFDIVGSSPEALVTVHDGRATMHPIAGSRPRGATPEEDNALAEEILADPKERAEHVMLVDLARNDLGRISTPGSVEVIDFMKVERYSHIMHIVSTVVGQVDPAYDALDVLAATFPAGTLSGAPKVRAMEIIEELEPTRRGLYGGVVGYVDFAGDLDTAIAIRTAVVRDGTVFVQAGAGLVADSDPATEDAECRHKANTVLSAVAIAEAMRRPTASGDRLSTPRRDRSGCPRRPGEILLAVRPARADRSRGGVPARVGTGAGGGRPAVGSLHRPARRPSSTSGRPPLGTIWRPPRVRSASSSSPGSLPCRPPERLSRVIVGGLMVLAGVGIVVATMVSALRPSSCGRVAGAAGCWAARRQGDRGRGDRVALVGAGRRRARGRGGRR